MVQFHPGSLDDNWSVSVSAARVLGKDEGRVQFPDGPLTKKWGRWSNGTTLGLHPGNRGSTPRRSTYGLMVQRDDASSAGWKFGFNSR